MSNFNNAPDIGKMKEYLDKKDTSNTNNNTQWWSIPKGMSSVRILPPWDPTGRIALPVLMHPIEYQGEGMKYKKYNWTCLNKTFGKPCKICEGLQELSSAGVDVEKYEASRRQFYMNVIVMYDPIHEEDIKKGKSGRDVRGVAPGTMVIMRTPKTIYDWVVSNITNPMIGDITSVETGIDVYITKEGEGLGTSYTATLSPNGRTAIQKEYLDKIEEIYNLDEIFSTGFDDDQINKLVDHLRKSAGYISNNMSQQVQQMAGYNMPNAVPQQYPTANQNTGSTPPWVATQQSVNQIPSIPQVPTQAQVAPQATVSNVPNLAPNIAETVTDKSEPSRPKCYGQYSPTQVNCVVCSHELDCKKTSGQ